MLETSDVASNNGETIEGDNVGEVWVDGGFYLIFYLFILFIVYIFLFLFFLFFSSILTIL